MSRPVAPDELLRLAYHLAETEPRRSRPVWLRRAISSAYYALFHELVARSVSHVLTAALDRDRERWLATRWYQHGDVRRVSEWVSALAHQGRGVPESITALFGGPDALTEIPADLVVVAASFVELHKARERADYDHAFDVTKDEAVALVDLAAGAVSAWRGLADTYHAELFLTLLLGGPRLVRSR